MKIQTHDIYYKVSFSKDVEPLNGSRYYTEFAGEIMFRGDEDDKKIGEFLISQVNMGARLNDGIEDAFQTVDVTSITSDVAGELLTNDFEDVVETIVDGDFCHTDFTIIERIKLDEQYRGMHIGLYVLRDFINHYVPSESIVAVKPSPFFYEVENETDAQIEKRKKKLEKHWRKLGFRAYLDKEYMYMKTCLQMPEIELRNKKKKMVLA